MRISREGKAFLHILLASFLFSLKLAAGDLSWKEQTLQHTAQAGEKKFEAEFSFTNASSHPVEIRSIRTSCGCTTAALGKKVYQPGESGSVKSVFTYGSRKGSQKKTIVVQTKSGNDILTLQVDIPDSIKVDKERLSWLVGEPLEAQFFEIRPLDAAAKIKSVKALGKTFEAELEEIGGNYRVSVTPLTTEQTVNSTIRVEIADPAPRSIYLPVQVQN